MVERAVQAFARVMRRSGRGIAGGKSRKEERNELRRQDLIATSFASGCHLNMQHGKNGLKQTTRVRIPGCTLLAARWPSSKETRERVHSASGSLAKSPPAWHTPELKPRPHPSYPYLTNHTPGCLTGRHLARLGMTFGPGAPSRGARASETSAGGPRRRFHPSSKPVTSQPG